MDRLEAVGCGVYGFDFRGHGRSSGKQAYIASFDELLRDLDLAYKRLPKDNRMIYAHSMGSLVVAKWIITRRPNDLKGVILSSGLFKLDDSVAPILRKLARFLSFVVPWIKAAPINSSTISRLKSEVELYNNDPLIYRGGTTARYGYEMMKAMKFVSENAAKINQRIMIIQGDSDALTNMVGSEDLYEHISSESKSIQIFEGGYHELLNDECQEKYMDLVVSFLAGISDHIDENSTIIV